MYHIFVFKIQAMGTKHKHKVVIAVTPYSIERCRILMGLYSFENAHCRWDIEMLPNASLIDEKSIDRMIKEGIDGLIASKIDSPQVLKKLEKSRIKSVVMDTATDYAPSPISNISFYDASVAGAATGATGFKFLESCGKFRSYAFIANKEPTSWSTNRMSGFMNEAAKNGVETAIFSEFGHNRRQQMKRFLISLQKPAAVMAANDWTALETLNCCRRTGIDIPGQICLLGVDDNELICTHATPTLSSIRINHEKIGMELAKMLHKMLGRKWKPSNVLIPEMESSVTERESTKPPVPAAHLIHKGLDYIKAHANEPITVSDVVKHLGVSRRLAELRFAELHGNTIADTIRNHRLEQSRNMLENSSLNIGSIAKSCGFPSRRSAEILFKAQFGLTMGEYRNRHSKTR